MKKGEFQKGSIEPKIIAAIHFLKHHGKKVVITSIPYIENALNETAGTIIVVFNLSNGTTDTKTFPVPANLIPTGN